MSSYKFLVYVLILLSLIKCILNSQQFGPQPRIISSNGHLTFISAENKNVQFVTQGKGKILLNNADLTEAANLVGNASKTLQQMNTDYYDTHFQVQKFKRILEGHHGILDRLNFLEANGSVSRNPTGNRQVYSISVINRRLRLMQRKVNRLMVLLTKNECISNPCKNGGTCQDLFNNFICQCPDEWEGPVCDKDVNECFRFSGTDLGCQNGATCVNKPGTYECLCARGWFGIHCTRQTASCTLDSIAELCGHGTCIAQNNAKGYKCLCDQGWTIDETSFACMKDIDECSSHIPSCSKNPPVECINTQGSFHCGSCPQGYTGNGYYCNDLDECAVFNGGCSINPHVQCINTPGSRICGSCPPGYVGDGLSCSFEGICKINNGGCHYLAQCRDNPQISSSYIECLCPEGYVGSGIGSNGCILSSTVNNTCVDHTCVHGTCIPNSAGSYNCRCNRKFTGRNCDIRKNPCQPNPCSNGGTCQNISNLSYTCICTSDYTGDTCNKPRQACGGVLLGFSGTLKYPPTNSIIYNHHVNCAWIIQTNRTKVLNVTFTQFNLEASNNCRYDWLQIHDGRNSAAFSLGRFCGNTLPKGGNIITTHNMVYLWFRSDSTLANSGFELNWNSISPVCGDNLVVTSHGTIHSPGFPGNYPVNRDCYWSLSAPLGKRLQFHFFSLVIGNNSNCDYDFLSIHEGYSISDRILAKYCNTSHPEPLYSSGPEVFIHFHSDASITYPGFQVSYTIVEGIPGCGGVYTASEGELFSPSIDGQYLPDVVCEYNIIVAKNSRIKMTFLSFDIEDEETCSYDSLTIHEGGSADSPIINRYCGSNFPPPYISQGNELFIIFTSDWGNAIDNQAGFRIKYETVCGGIYSSPSGIITSPGYPTSYLEDKMCIYEIVQPLGTTIFLTFTDFDVETTSYDECLFGFVEIHDGDNENSTLIGKYCTKIPPDVQSSYNYLWIKFKTDSVMNGGGFSANYTTTALGCGGILKKNNDIIKSPEHPNLYPSDLTCVWVISAPPGNVIQLSWLMFNLEESIGCTFDYIQMYSNYSNNDLMGTYCGNKLPPTLISTTNVLTIKFFSDDSITSEGFMISYRFIDERNACGGQYYSSSGEIKSPLYPNDYPTNRECVWIITVNDGEQILLNITDFSLELFSECTYDYLEIRNGGTIFSPLIGRYCGTTIPKQIPSHANQLYIIFNSDMSYTERGFKITWQSTTTGCGGSLTSAKGSIISPFYPELYSENTDCHWKISVSAGSLIQLIFVDIDLENTPNCEMDYVMIFDGPDIFSKSLGKFCTPSNAQLIQSTSNHLNMLFRSDGSIQTRGFHIQYNTICQNTLKGFRGTIESPNFPVNYPRVQKCVWKIEVPQGNKINITFSHFEVDISTNTENKSCSANYLEIKYQEGNDMIKYNTYCGLDAPSLITINSNIAEIHFVSDDQLIGSGFRLEWTINGCGGLLTHPSGSISTPNYPNGYPEGTQCDWVIQVEYGYSIEITFISVDFEISGNCVLDYILITNGHDETYPTLTKFCMKGNKPIVVTSTGNTMFVRFFSDFSYNGRGFWANYTTLPTKCGGTLSSPAGSFHSPNYPQNYDIQDNCEWLIDVEDGHIIELNFKKIDLPYDCNLDYIKIYDGPTIAYPVLVKICGNTKVNKTIKSTRNYMVVEMRTGSHVAAQGFLANYSLACGARIVTQSSGLINQLDTTLLSTDLENCSWTIIASNLARHVSLSITHMDAVDYCSYNDYPVKIYNGESNRSPLIAQFCDGKIPPPITSEGNALHIEVDNVAMNFAAKYYMLDTTCGGVFTGAAGFFATPRYPNNYLPNVQCEWTIRVAPGNQITLSFSEFDLMSSENCNVDYLEIRALNKQGELLGTFCDQIPTNITQVGNLWILFKSGRVEGDHFGATGKGFLGQYSLVHGIDLTGPSGQIASPLYPLYYFQTGYFDWTITVTFGKGITISFLEFYIESYDEMNCYLSNLEVYDGVDSDAPLLKSVCGLNTPEPITSTSNIMYIKMIYDTILHGSKFLLEWIEIDIAPKEPTIIKKNDDCETEEIIDMSELDSYTLKSPGYPHGYSLNLNCKWIFTTTTDYHLEISFLKVDVDNFAGQCGLDNIQVYNGRGGAANWELVGTVCFPNATSDVNIATSNLMKVVFYTDSFVNQTGFEARINKVCGGSITETNKIIAINATQFSYRDKCEWNVTVHSGKTIEVTFLEMNLGNNKNGPCDNYIMLKNGHYLDSPILGKGKYCDNTIIEPLYTTGNYLYIKYLAYSGKSFKLSYKEISQNCGGSFMLSKQENETEISSPNYPNIPPPFTECFWTFIAPPGESLRIDFEERFDIMESDDCEFSAVEIRDGGSRYSPILGRYCEQIPNSTFSSDNMMHVRFFANVDDPRNGFKAKISIASCGGVIRSEIGEVRSPNFNRKNGYPKNSNCIWHIIGPKGHYLIMRFIKIDLEGTSPNCSDQDHITLEERFKYNETLKTIGTYCGNRDPGEIKSSSNEVIVHLVTGNSESTYAGFNLHFNSSQEKCGGNLFTESGIIESPGYPVSDYEDRTCEWFIKVPEGRRITFQFINFDINLHSYDYGLAFFEDENYFSTIKYSKDINSSEPIKSTSNTMTVFFWITSMANFRGFQARYSSDEPTLCRGDFSKDSGIIESLNRSSYYCEWKHTLSRTDSETLSLVVKMNFAVPTSLRTSCRYPISAVMITTENEEQYIAKFCTSLTHPAIIRSPYIITRIVGCQNKRQQLLQYTINYATHPCGGIITNEKGFITSPGFPNKYSRTVECAWLLKLPSDQRIKVNFTNVNLDNNCEYNFIIIYNGDLPVSPKIGHFCQNNKPNIINAQGNNLFIEYHADERSSGTGFQINYEPIIGGCSGIYHDDTRIIETPLYPNNYPNNTECLWEIISKNGYYLQLSFVDRFYIEQSESCKQDFLEVLDYVNDTWKSLGKICGRNTPSPFKSTSNRMKIMFRSNDKIRATGFKAQWMIYCGGTFIASAKKQYIVSPGYPNEYNNSLECIYKIVAPNGFVNLKFEDFSLEEDSICKYDNVTISTRQNSDSYAFPNDAPKVYCGNKKPPVIRNAESVTITFRTDEWNTNGGFKISYKTDSCGSVITEPTVISMPDIEDSIKESTYISVLNCLWNITAPFDKIVLLKFIKFELEHNIFCSYDSISIYDGLTTNVSSRLALLCGNLTNHLPVIKSTGNSMTVLMKTDYVNHFAGFRAIVYFNYGPQAGCGGTIAVSNNKIIEAPLGLLNLDCQWEIITTKDHILKISFIELNLIPCSTNRTIRLNRNDCTCNTIQIRDGSGPFSELIDEVCDNSVPREYTTSGHTAWLRLFTIGTTKDRAFKVSINKIPTICGQQVLNVTNQTQILTSPNFPNSYPNNIKCSWLLKGKDYLNRIDLHFTDFDLVESRNEDFLNKKCNEDRIEIADKMHKHQITDSLGTATIFSGSNSMPVYGNYRLPIGIHKFCGKYALSFDHYSGENEVTVTFYSGFKQHGKGFKLEYRLTGCNRNFTSVQGRIMNSDVKNSCIITITVPANYTIALHFNSFTMFDSGQCKKVGFEVHDGDSQSSPLLAKLCGYSLPNSIFSSGRNLWINVWNNNINTLAVYDAMFTSTPSGKGCGGTFYNYAGRFTSPLYPGSYRKSEMCIWEIIVPQEMSVALKFTVFDINGATVEVITYNTDNSVNTEHRFVKNDNPAVLQSQNNHMTVKYISTINSGGTGWVAQFLAINTDTKLEWTF